MNTCDTCRHWGSEPYVQGETTHQCGNERIGENDGDDSISIEGYEYECITTGPKFGCAHHCPMKTI